jgi:hypothetical protein
MIDLLTILFLENKVLFYGIMLGAGIISVGVYKWVLKKINKPQNKIREDYIEVLKEVAFQAKQLAVCAAGSFWKLEHIDTVEINESGKVTVCFSYYCRGSEDREYVELMPEDFIDDFEIVVERYKKKQEDKNETLRLSKIQREEEQKAYQKESDRKTYERLKKDFGD